MGLTSRTSAIKIPLLRKRSSVGAPRVFLLPPKCSKDRNIEGNSMFIVALARLRYFPVHSASLRYRRVLNEISKVFKDRRESIPRVDSRCRNSAKLCSVKHLDERRADADASLWIILRSD